MAQAVAGYVAGALLIALIAGVTTYIVLTILGVPFRGPLALIAGLFSLIPLIGATIAAVLIGLVTVFNDFPTTTIIWVIWAIAYQQFENHVIQPQVQKRTVNVQPFITIVAVLFGATLLGVLGALVAIPIAASIQILLREYVDLRTMSHQGEPAAAAARAAAGAPATASATGRAAGPGTGVGEPLASARHEPGSSRTARSPARDHSGVAVPARPGAAGGVRRLRQARRVQPALVGRDGRPPDRQLRVHVGGPEARDARRALGTGDHLPAGLERVRSGGSRRRGRVAGAMQYAMLARGGVPSAQAASGMTASSVLVFGILLALPLLALPAVLFGAPVDPGLGRAALIGGVVFVLLFAAGAAAILWDRPLLAVGRVAQSAAQPRAAQARAADRPAVAAAA